MLKRLKLLEFDNEIQGNKCLIYIKADALYYLYTVENYSYNQQWAAPEMST